ncbi:MAG: DUF5916 domain-containing protein [Saprospiraceae bacterium]|nr:DUF5916 domain-containing protein [Saprospiraceae bacterium]
MKPFKCIFTWGGTLLLFIFCYIPVFSQDSGIYFDQKELTITHALDEIKIDGHLSESIWSSLEKHSNFVMQNPIDGEAAHAKTEVMIFHSDKGIYVAATLYDDDQYIIQTLKRDNYDGSDAFSVLIDAVGERTNGFGFGVNALGSPIEVLISPEDVDASWDNKWYVATQNMPDKWTVEMMIPFKSLRFKKGVTEWGINFSRQDPGRNETYVWSPVPRQFSFTDLGYFARMKWTSPPTGSGSNISLIPYLSSNATQNYDPESDIDGTIDVGGDAKIGITSGLNLDLTVNPDFSQVEVDRQITNLGRFNIFFPERRQFFIENADVFNAYGQGANQPFYSRRIGLDPVGNTVPILYGARLTGNVNEKLRIGALNMHTRSNDVSYGQNFTAITAQQRIGQRSNLRGLFLNRQAFDGSELIDGDFGRNYGGELNLVSNDGKVAGQLGLINSQKDGVEGKNNHIYGRFDYTGQRFRTFLFVQHLGENYYADMGFNARINNFDPLTNSISRIGYTQVGNMLDYYIYPESETVNFHWSGIENFVVINDGTGLNEWYTRFRHFIFFQNTSELRFRINHIYTDLIFAFPISNPPLPVGEYDVWEYNVQYRSDQRKTMTYSLFAVYGGFFNGNKFTYIADATYRRQPWGNFTLGMEHNIIRLPEEFEDQNIIYANARAEVNFSTSLFWTTFAQYNTQAKRFNLNTRLQWRYAPMSDLFLVYTDDYSTVGRLNPQQRSLVLKVSYWLGV